MSRILIAACFVLVWASSVQGARDIEFNVDFACGWDGYYRPMEWTPVEIRIGSDLTQPFAGSFHMSARQDGLNTLNIVHTFVLTPDRPLSIPLATKFAFATDRCTLSIRNERGRTQWQQAVDLMDYSAQNRLFRVAQEQDLLIGLIGQAQFGVLRLPQDATCMSERGQGKVCLGSKVPYSAPWDWTGYASLDLLILCDPDWSLMQPPQIRAIREWVSNGGTVLLVLGQHPLPPESPLMECLPFQIGEPRQVQVPSPALEEWGLDATRPQTVTAWSLTPKPKAVPLKKIETPETGCLYGVGYAGFGRMAVLAFSPSQLGDGQTHRSAAFWTRHIAACCAPEARAASGSLSGSGRRIVLAETASQGGASAQSGFNQYTNRYQISVAQDASNKVMEYLYELEQMQPLSIWWVILTLVSLAVLLGPVDYFVLKRLDKLPYTWLTSAGWIAMFTVGAYFGVQWLRGGVMELRAVSVLDGIADSNCAWTTGYASLFAPRSDNYQLSGLMPNQWWSGIAPTRQELWAGQHETGMQQIHCLQADGGNLPVSLPVNMWTVQPLLGEWAMEKMPFTATVERRDNEAVVEIRNTSDSSIQRGFVLFADTCADLGPVPARSTKRFDVRTRPFRSWQPPESYPVAGRPGRYAVRPGQDIPRYPGALSGTTDQAFFAQGSLGRTLVMHRYLEAGAALVCVVFDGAPVPVGVKDHSYKVNHVQLARQVVRPTSE